MPAPLFGHVGDGNFHVVLVVDPGSQQELVMARQLNSWLIERALEADEATPGMYALNLMPFSAPKAFVDVTFQLWGEGRLSEAYD